MRYKKQISYSIVFVLSAGIVLLSTNAQKLKIAEEMDSDKQLTYKTNDYPSKEAFQTFLYDKSGEFPYNNQNEGIRISRGSKSDIHETSSNSIIGVITADDVNVRNYPDTSLSDVVVCVDKGAKVSIKAKWNNWYKIVTPGKVNGWIKGDFVNIGYKTSRSGSSTDAGIPVEKPEEVMTTGQKLVNYAKKFLGVRYVWGGTSPAGFDCSGFAKYVYSRFGVSLQRVAADQARQGTQVSKSNLKTGDLVFFDTDGGHNYINHVGIYIGGGQFIEASSGNLTHRVVISNLNSGFYANTYMTARRIF